MLEEYSFSEQQEGFGEFNFKRANIKGEISDSNQQSDSSESDQNEVSHKKRNNYSKKINSILSAKDASEDKTKIIKKNCQSAKMSRQRKRIYLDLLEKRAQELRQEIQTKRFKIQDNNQRIYKHFQQSNYEKFKYLKEKISLSKRMVDLQKQSKKKNAQTESPSFGSSQSGFVKEQNQSILRDQKKVANSDKLQKVSQGKKQKASANLPEIIDKNYQQTIQSKRDYLNILCEMFVHKFGMQGCLKNDVIQRSKNQWFQIISANQDKNKQQWHGKLSQVKCYFEKIEKHSKITDKHFRDLQEITQPSKVITFLLDKEFLDEERLEKINSQEQQNSQFQKD